MTAALQLLYWFCFFSKLSFYKEKNIDPVTNGEEVSVIICAKDEAEQLSKNLKKVLQQDYAQSEVLVMDDGSQDATFDILTSLSASFPQLKVAKVKGKPLGTIGKKYALWQGILQSRFDKLLLTDADCCPSSERWITIMQSHLTAQKDIVLGYAPYRAAKGLLNKFVRFETVLTAIQYFSYALTGIPYMGVGRNLLYRKKIFIQAGGFEAHKQIASGDDDLFINQVANAHNVAITLHPDTFMYSEAKRTWKDYFKQKLRHLSTATAYKKKHQILLGTFATSLVVNNISLILLLLNNFSTVFVITITIYALSTIAKMSLYAPILKMLHEKSLFWWIPLLELMMSLYFMILTPLSLLKGKPNTWM